MAPSKVSGFSWLVIHDRVPTEANLIHRRVLQDNGDQGCIFCDKEWKQLIICFCIVISPFMSGVVYALG
jgi:hypothetical protein